MRNFTSLPLLQQQAQTASEIIKNAKEVLGEETQVIPSRKGGFIAFTKCLKTGNIVAISKVFPTEMLALSNNIRHSNC